MPLMGLWVPFTVSVTYLDEELQIFIHGEDMVKNILSNPGNDAHVLGVVQFTL